MDEHGKAGAAGPEHDLRAQARRRLGATRTDVEALSTEDVQALIEELQIHQVELEIQNEELRDAQQQLLAVRDRFAELYEFAPVGYLTLDAGATIVQANLEAAGILDIDRDELLGRHFSDFVVGESQDVFYQCWQNQMLLSTRSTTDCELELRDGKGARRAVHVRAQSLEGEDDSSVRVFWALVDITERKQAERALEQLNTDLEWRIHERSAELRRREEELRVILDTAPEGILAADPEGTIRTANRAARRMFDEVEGQLRGRRVDELLPGTERWWPVDRGNSRPQRASEGRAFGRDVVRMEAVARPTRGAPFPARVSMTPVPEHDRFLVVVTDISRPRQLEREILNVAEAERRRIGRELHDTVGQSLAGLAMIVRSQEKRLEGCGEEVRAAFAECRERLETAVRDTRDVIHDLAPPALDKEGLAHGLERLAQSVSTQHRGCTCDFAGREPDLALDAKVQLLRIATEAVHNTLKHADATNIGIRLESAKQEVVLSVTDDGIGIGSTAEGMGLGIMRHRAQAIGGRLEVMDARPRGTVVKAIVPF